MTVPADPPAMACEAFAADISALVDHELEGPAAARVVQHMDGCEPCREAFDAFRRLSRVGRLAVEDLDAAMVASVDPRKLFGGVTRCLVDEKGEELSKLFYQLGKAYALTANRALDERERQSVLGAAKPVDIRGSEVKARRVLREAQDLERLGEHRRPSGSLFRRSRQLFEARRAEAAGATGAVKTALLRARRFLEESLALAPARDEARLWLGFTHALCGRHDRARLEFRRVYLGERDRRAADQGLPRTRALHRLMALQALGKLHSVEGDYARAVECFREVVSDELAATEVGLFPSFLNLAVNCAKAGLRDESIARFAALIEQFPARLEQIRGLLARKGRFQELLDHDPHLHADLSRRVPALFAA